MWLWSLVDDYKWFWWSRDLSLSDPVKSKFTPTMKKYQHVMAISYFAFQRDGIIVCLLSIHCCEHLQMSVISKCNVVILTTKTGNIRFIALSVLQLLCSSTSEWCYGQELVGSKPVKLAGRYITVVTLWCRKSWVVEVVEATPDISSWQEVIRFITCRTIGTSSKSGRETPLSLSVPPHV